MRRFLVIAWCVAASSLISGHAQPSSPPPEQTPTFRTGVDVIAVDVAVTDSRGRPVEDLLTPDFLVKIDGETGETSSVSVPFPGGVTFGKDQKLYVAAFSTSTENGMGFPGSDGQIWRVPLDAFDTDAPQPTSARKFH